LVIPGDSRSLSEITPDQMRRFADRAARLKIASQRKIMLEDSQERDILYPPPLMR
jgi:hypothetical protein